MSCLDDHFSDPKGAVEVGNTLGGWFTPTMIPSQTLASSGGKHPNRISTTFVTLLETHNNKFIYPMKVSDDYSTQLSFFWWEIFGRFFQGLNCLLGVRECCENGSQHFAAQQDVSPC